MMKRIKKITDEREELELLRIEHIGFWFLFWGLFISVLVQAFFMKVTLRQIAPEWILFMLSCLIIGIGCLRKGLWDYYTTPSLKTYFLFSLASAVVVGTLFGIAKWNTYEVFRENIFGMLLPAVLIFAGSIFVLTFGALYVTGKLTLQRRRKLAEKYGEDE